VSWWVGSTGWSADPIVTANLRWLAGYRHPRHGVAGVAQALRAVFAQPVPLHPSTTVTTAVTSLVVD
jgi:hypothetical protein